MIPVMGDFQKSYFVKGAGNRKACRDWINGDNCLNGTACRYGAHEPAKNCKPKLELNWPRDQAIKTCRKQLRDEGQTQILDQYPARDPPTAAQWSRYELYCQQVEEEAENPDHESDGAYLPDSEEEHEAPSARGRSGSGKAKAKAIPKNGAPTSSSASSSTARAPAGWFVTEHSSGTFLVSPGRMSRICDFGKIFGKA